MKKTVCIIGSGASGLVTLKSLIDSNSKTSDGILLEPFVFEKCGSIGGCWSLIPGIDLKDNPMYFGLKTNLPKEIMRFSDFPSENYGDVEESFVSQEDVLTYLSRYAEYNKLSGFIQVNRKVTNIKLIPNEELKSEPRWSVTVENVLDDEQNWEFEFDFVIICNGHHNKRKYPMNYDQIKQSFKGTLLHSMDYKNPENFKGKSVVVAGGGPSGIDIAAAISPFAEKVYLSTKDLKTRTLSNVETLTNFRQTPVIKFAKENSVILENDEEIESNVIILSTGYEYEYPFLDDGIMDIKEAGKQVNPLYLHMIHMKYNSLCFIGIPYIALAFNMFEFQALFYTAYMRGHLALPSELEMQEHFRKDQIERKTHGLHGPKTHLLHFTQWPYCRKLATQGGFMEDVEHLLPMYEKVYQACIATYFTNPLFFRDSSFEDILRDCGFDRESSAER